MALASAVSSDLIATMREQAELAAHDKGALRHTLSHGSKAIGARLGPRGARTEYLSNAREIA